MQELHFCPYQTSAQSRITLELTSSFFSDGNYLNIKNASSILNRHSPGAIFLIDYHRTAVELLEGVKAARPGKWSRL